MKTYTGARAPSHPTCEAHLPTLRVAEYGFERIGCHQWRGLRTFFDADGTPRHACGAHGHLADVVRRFGAMPHGDAMTAAMTEAERREAFGR